MNAIRRCVVCVGAVLAAAACSGQEPDGASPSDGAVKLSPTTVSPAARAAFVLGQRAFDVGRTQEAHEHFLAAVAEDPGFAWAHLLAAYSSPSGPEFRRSLRRAAENLEGASEAERLLVQMGQTYLSDDADRRLELARQLTEAHPTSPRAWLNLAIVRQERDEQGDARAALRRALELDPGFYAARQTLGLSYLFEEPRDFDAARGELEACTRLDPEEAKGFEYLGDAHRGAGDLESARAAYAAALERDPELGVASLKMGHVDSFLGRYEKARAAYDRAIQLARGPDRSTYANYRAFVSVHAGQPASALAELEAVQAGVGQLELSEDQATAARIFALTNAATVALHAGLSDRAADLLRRRAALVRAQAARDGDADTRRLTEAGLRLWDARLAVARGDLEAARSAAEEHRSMVAADRNPRRLEGYHMILGLIALREGDGESAVERLRQADPDDVYVKYHLARALESAGRTDGATRLFRDVARTNFNSVEFALVRRDAERRGA